jgi:hypothetical protein
MEKRPRTTEGERPIETKERALKDSRKKGHQTWNMTGLQIEWIEGNQRQGEEGKKTEPPMSLDF